MELHELELYETAEENATFRQLPYGDWLLFSPAKLGGHSQQVD